MIARYNRKSDIPFFYNEDSVFIFEVLCDFFRKEGYFLSFFYLRKYTDRDGNILSFSNIYSPPIGKNYIKTTFVIEFIETIMSFYKVESLGFCRKKITDFKKIRESIVENKTETTIEEELEIYCKIITNDFDKRSG